MLASMSIKLVDGATMPVVTTQTWTEMVARMAQTHQ